MHVTSLPNPLPLKLGSAPSKTRFQLLKVLSYLHIFTFIYSSLVPVLFSCFTGICFFSHFLNIVFSLFVNDQDLYLNPIAPVNHYDLYLNHYESLNHHDMT